MADWQISQKPVGFELAAQALDTTFHCALQLGSSINALSSILSLQIQAQCKRPLG